MRSRALGALVRPAAGKVRAPALAALAVVLAVSLIALIVAIARARSEPPARCAAGLIALGPRCCGEGQHLTSGRCDGPPRRCASGMQVTETGCVVEPRIVRVDGGLLRIGPGDWEAQGAVEPLVEAVAPFLLDAFEVTEARYIECEASGACTPIAHTGEPGRAVASVSLDEAARFCAWAGGSLPTSAELAFAASGPKSSRYPWGDTGAVCRRAAWGLRDGPCSTGADGPELAGSHPDGRTPSGIHDLSGNVAEWTRPARAGAATTEARGGSWADGVASALRTWNRRIVPGAARSPEIGFRCAYRALP
jgi:formylglycine-generating enzyme required for sulfatase activity